MTHEEMWLEKYVLLKQFIEKNGHLPNKKKVENRGLLNWWKYNMKLVKQGRLDGERLRLLQELSDMRTSVKLSFGPTADEGML